MDEIKQITRDALLPKLKEAVEAFNIEIARACVLTKELYDQHYGTLIGFMETNPTLKKSHTYKASLGVFDKRGKKLKCPDKNTHHALFGVTLCVYQAALGVDDGTMRNTSKQASREGVDKPHKNHGAFLFWLVQDMAKKL
ncbi:MAG: hypothetical protein RTU30_12510 [Candidatus Thorarchaeota archaeon]